MTMLYNGDRLMVMLNFEQFLIGVSFDPFGGVALHFVIVIVHIRLVRKAKSDERQEPRA